MNIIYKPETPTKLTFKDIKHGEVFEHDNRHYIKIQAHDGSSLALYLENSTAYPINKTAECNPKKSTLTIE